MSDVKELLRKATELNSMVGDEEWLTQIALAYDNMEPITLAIYLKEALNDPMLVAMALRKVIVKYPAIVVGRLLLNDQMYPELSREEMKNILNNAFLKKDLERAISILYPLIFEVDAAKVWNDTGIDVFPDEIVKIRYLSGYWSVNPSSGWCVASGRPPRGKFGYTLYGEFEGCLVGRIDTEDNTIPNFYVGAVYSGSGLGTEKGSRLYLAANDDVNRLYGKGFTDNIGSLTVEISKELDWMP